MMFNLKKAHKSDDDLLYYEMRAHGIIFNGHKYICTIGDQCIEESSLSSCLSKLLEGISEVKQDIWHNWHRLSEVSSKIIENKSNNSGSIDNLLFLNSVKKSYLLSKLFTDLLDITSLLHQLFSIDIIDVDSEMINKFNILYLKIKCEHRLIMSDIYRVKLIKKYMRLTKTAQSISGPWANLDLPMQERVWSWEDEDKEYFDERTKSRKGQTRYNPEYNKDGYYFVWVDRNRDPYSFDSFDSPYPHRNQLLIP